MPTNVLGKSRPPFHVKLPVRTFEGGVRGMLIHAGVPHTNADYCKATFFCDDSKVRTVQMLTRQAQALSANGPFVVLHEVDGDAGDAAGALGIISPDGTPLA